jgi:aconitate hydratase
LSGTFTDPRDVFRGIPYPSIADPDVFLINDNMIVPPFAAGNAVDIYRGPNIGEPPSNEPCPEKLNGIITIKVGDLITTDHIMPAGSRLKYRSNIPKYAEYVFEREDPAFASRAAAYRDRGLYNIIVAGDSYGQGSSREHAAICPMFLGVKMVIAKSIERIHRANLINFGIIPALFVDPADYNNIPPDATAIIDDLYSSLAGGKSVKLNIGDKKVRLAIDLTERELEMILAGGLINATRGKGRK